MMENNKNININDFNSTQNHYDLGAIWIDKSDSVKINKSILENNIGDTLAVYNIEQTKLIDITELECRNNKNKESGCIRIYGFKSGSDQSIFEVRNSTFYNNTSLENGGAFRGKYVNIITIRDSFFKNNIALETGGSIYSSDSN